MIPEAKTNRNNDAIEEPTKTLSCAVDISKRSPATVSAPNSDDETTTFLVKTPSAINCSDGSIELFCFDLSQLSPPVRFIVLSLCVFALSIISAGLDEYIFHRIPGYNFGWFTTAFELSAFALFAVLEMVLRIASDMRERRAPLKEHALVALAMTIGRGLANMSLTYLNYPTQVIFKSMKLIVVIAGNVIMHRDLNRFSCREYVAALLLVSSAAAFALGDVKVSPSFSLIGIPLVLVSLLFNAVHSNTQEHVLQIYNASVQELMVFGNLFGAFFALLITIAGGELGPALQFCKDNPNVFLVLSARMLFAYSSVMCYVLLIKSFGAVLATTVTTVRKVMTVVLSFLVFAKPFHAIYLVAVVCFSIGAVLQISETRRKKQQKRSGKTLK